VRRAILIVLVLALCAGVAGNVVERAVYGPNGPEHAYQQQLAAALRANDHTAYQALIDQNPIDISQRELAWSTVPVVVVLGIGVGIMLVRRRGTPPQRGDQQRRFA
jgi:hypothetical protein